MKNTALILIDIQNDYFDGGKMALPGARQAGETAAKILALFRKNGMPVFHIQHESVRAGATFFLPGTDGQAIHPSVRPIAGEPVITKHWPNSFLGTDLLRELSARSIKRVVVAGMMTSMCIDATVRAAKDLGFECILIHDATASPALAFNGVSATAEQTGAAFLAALSHLCDRVVSGSDFISESDGH